MINVDYIDVHKKEQFHFVDGIFDLCKAAKAREYKIIVITNQSGVSRGIFTLHDVVTLHDYMRGEFMKVGAELTDIYICTSRDNAHIDRKPNPGMLLKAMEQHLINMKKSIMVGDKERDILAGKSAGCGKNIMFSDGLFDTKADLVVKDLRDIIDCL